MPTWNPIPGLVVGLFVSWAQQVLVQNGIHYVGDEVAFAASHRSTSAHPIFAFTPATLMTFMLTSATVFFTPELGMAPQYPNAVAFARRLQRMTRIIQETLERRRQSLELHRFDCAIGTFGADKVVRVLRNHNVFQLFERREGGWDIPPNPWGLSDAHRLPYGVLDQVIQTVIANFTPRSDSDRPFEDIIASYIKNYVDLQEVTKVRTASPQQIMNLWLILFKDLYGRLPTGIGQHADRGYFTPTHDIGRRAYGIGELADHQRPLNPRDIVFPPL
jgi:hypothetical protein